MAEKATGKGTSTQGYLAALASIVVPVTVAIIGYYGKEIASAQQREIEEAKLRYSYVTFIVDILQKKTEKTDQNIVCWSWRNLSANSASPFTAKEIEDLCKSKATLPGDVQFGTPRVSTYTPLAPNSEIWQQAKLAEEKKTQIKSAVDRMVAKKARYETVVQQTSIPWYIVAIIHQLETGGDFSTHLHNGDSLSARTVHAPTGRPASGQPPFTWEDSAKDAIESFDLKNIDWNNAGSTLDFFERLNGLGYRRRGVPSPYLWACTDQYKSGKFMRQNAFNPNVVSAMCGAAAYFIFMKNGGIIPADALN